MDWLAFLLGLTAGVFAEAAVGAFVTAPLAVWYLKRSLARTEGSVLDAFLSNDKLVEKVRQRFINAVFGASGGRPVSITRLAKTSATIAVQEVVPALVKRVVGRFQHSELGRQIAKTPPALPAPEVPPTSS